MGKVISLFGGRNAEPVGTDALRSQLSLPFANRHKFVSILAVHSSGPDGFANLVERLHVQLILDFRTAPRLDFVAPTRLQAFKYFDEHEISYRDLIGRLGVTSYASMDLQVISLGVAEILRELDASAGIALAVFDSPAFQDICSQCFDGIYEVECLDVMQVHHYETEDRLRM